jgi:hypothetical protein
MLLLDGGAIEVPLEGERAEAAPAAPAKTDGEPR